MRKRLRSESGAVRISLPRDAQSRLCKNYLTVGLTIRLSFSDDVFPDPILELVLGYCGPPTSFLVSVMDLTDDCDYEDRFEIVGIFDSRPAAVMGALEDAQEKDILYDIYVQEDDDPNEACDYKSYKVFPYYLNDTRREQLFETLKFSIEFAYTIQEFSIRSLPS
jgi:hypothetical protein